MKIDKNIENHLNKIPNDFRKRLPDLFLKDVWHFDRHPLEDYTIDTDRSVPTPEADNDPRTAFDDLDPEKPRGM